MALDRLYVADVPASGNARRRANSSTTAGYQFQPAWSPDGQTIAYITWTEAEGGHIWKIPAAGGTPDEADVIAS